MDQFVNLAKQFAGGNNNNEQQHQQQGQNFGNQGGPQFNAPHGSGGSSGGFGDILSMCESWLSHPLIHGILP
jgi:hypothetical protein